MVSNAASPLSGSLAKPKVCKPPPPPPPPGYKWPPDTFTLVYIGLWVDPYGVHHINVTFTMDNEGSGWQWVDTIIDGPNQYYATWSVNPETRLALLEMSWTHDSENGYSNKYDIPVTWGTPTLYEISDWDEKSPPVLRAEAEFTF